MQTKNTHLLVYLVHLLLRTDSISLAHTSIVKHAMLPGISIFCVLCGITLSVFGTQQMMYTYLLQRLYNTIPDLYLNYLNLPVIEKVTEVHLPTSFTLLVSQCAPIARVKII